MYESQVKVDLKSSESQVKVKYFQNFILVDTLGGHCAEWNLQNNNRLPEAHKSEQTILS